MISPDKGEWSLRYSDDSGVEFRVAFDAVEYDSCGHGPGLVEIEHINKIDWPIEKLDWLIDRLRSVRDMANTNEDDR